MGRHSSAHKIQRIRRQRSGGPRRSACVKLQSRVCGADDWYAEGVWVQELAPRVSLRGCKHHTVQSTEHFRFKFARFENAKCAAVAGYDLKGIAHHTTSEQFDSGGFQWPPNIS